MKKFLYILIPLAFASPIFSTAPLRAQIRETATVDAAGDVLNEIMTIPASKIPAWLLADAQGIAIMPSLVKGGFIVGVRHGHGVVVVRDEAGHWQPPVFVTITGGSVGWQVGLQATDVILVFKTRRSVQGLMSGKFTLGADVAAAAGPVGRQAEAATDSTLRAEILSYSRSRGLFAGVSLDGSVLQIDNIANAQFYGGMGAVPPALAPGQAMVVPPAAVKLLEVIGRYTAPPPGVKAVTTVPGNAVAGASAQAAPLPTNAVVVQAAHPAAAAEQARQDLADSGLRLMGLLDGSWKTYLALPGEVYVGDRPPNPAALRKVLDRFDSVSKDPRYLNLSQREEFQNTHQSLRKYLAIQSAPSPATTALPPQSPLR